MARVVNHHVNASDTCDGLQWERVAGVDGLVSPELSDEQAAAYLTLPYFTSYSAPVSEPQASTAVPDEVVVEHVASAPFATEEAKATAEPAKPAGKRPRTSNR